MPTLHLLGTGAAFSEPHRTTTMLAFQSGHSVLVVDCGGDMVQRLLAAEISVEQIEALIITHEHADHAGGFPLFMERIWVGGRRRPITVYGIAPAISQARRTFATFNTSDWEGLPEIQWHEVALAQDALVLQDEQWRVTAAPGTHSVPVVGLRVEDRKGGGVVAYSCDTERSEAITRLSRDADILVHEATGGHGGHSTAEEAAQVAREAKAKQLVLVHLPPADKLTDADMEAACRLFSDTEKGEELARYEF